jgi:hypothetical protein
VDSRLQSARDTFLHFLADNLPDTQVHARRYDITDPGADELMENAVNIEFLGVALDPLVSVQQASIDVIFTDERIAVDTVAKLWTLFRSAFYTTLLDYTNITPVSTGTNLMWDKTAVNFRRVYSGEYTHYVCLLPLKFNAA